MNINDRVYCFNGPVDDKVIGTVIKDNNINKVLVKFDNGEEWWCKYEWLDLESERHNYFD